jgi:hypothetical protein
MIFTVIPSFVLEHQRVVALLQAFAKQAEPFLIERYHCRQFPVNVD